MVQRLHDKIGEAFSLSFVGIAEIHIVADEQAVFLQQFSFAVGGRAGRYSLGALFFTANFLNSIAPQFDSAVDLCKFRDAGVEQNLVGDTSEERGNLADKVALFGHSDGKRKFLLREPYTEMHLL